MSAEQFEDRLLAELKNYVNEQSGQAGRAGKAVGRQESRRATPKRRSPWRLASGGISVAVAIAVAAVLANGASSTGSSASKAPSTTATGPLVHLGNAAFVIDTEASGAVDITILKGSGEPDVDALRSDLAKAGVYAKVVTSVPTCRQLADSAGAPSPVSSAQVEAVADAVDHPFFKNGDLVYSVDTSVNARGTTLWIMFSSTLSTIFVERTTDSGPQPNCRVSPTGN